MNLSYVFSYWFYQDEHFIAFELFIKSNHSFLVLMQLKINKYWIMFFLEQKQDSNLWIRQTRNCWQITKMTHLLWTTKYFWELLNLVIILHFCHTLKYTFSFLSKLPWNDNQILNCDYAVIHDIPSLQQKCDQIHLLIINFIVISIFISWLKTSDRK